MPAVYVHSVPVGELVRTPWRGVGYALHWLCGREFATFSRHNPFLKIVMELTKSFPPADAFVEMMMEIDYKKHYNTFMDGVEIFCAFVAAVAIIVAEKWQEHNMTERTQLFVLRVIEGAKTFYAWVMNVFVPEFKALIKDIRALYTYVRTVWEVAQGGFRAPQNRVL